MPNLREVIARERTGHLRPRVIVSLAMACLSACAPQNSDGSRNSADSAPVSTRRATDVAACSAQDASCQFPRDLFARVPTVLPEAQAALTRAGLKVPAWLPDSAGLELDHSNTPNGPATVAVVCENHYCFNVLAIYLRDKKVIGGFLRDNIDKNGIFFGDLLKPETEYICSHVRDCDQQLHPDPEPVEPQTSDDTIVFLNPHAEEVVRRFYLDCPGGQSATLMNVLRRAAHQGFQKNAYILATVDSRGDEVRIYNQVIHRTKGPLSEPRVLMSIDTFGELQLYGISREAVLLQCVLGDRVWL